jgi:hypothetical protein
MSRKEELEEIVAAGIVARHELSDITDKETEAKTKALVGECFRFRNSYGSGEKWWLYRIVTGVNGRNVYTFEFQKTANGEHRIEPRTVQWMGLDKEDKPISRKEFWDAWFDFMNGLEDEVNRAKGIE